MHSVTWQVLYTWPNEQVTKTSYESKEDLDDTLSFLAATVRAAYSAGAKRGETAARGRAVQVDPGLNPERPRLVAALEPDVR
jgi:hypothetical protein